MSTSGRKTAQECLPLRKAFKVPGFGMSAVAGVTGTGRMSKEDAAAYRADVGRITYTVLSYATPIAWVLDDGTVRKPAARYSATTSKHQGMLYLLGGAA